MKYPTIILTLIVLVFASMCSSCTSKSEPDAISGLAIHTEYNPIIIPYYMLEDEGLEIPPKGCMYRILNSQQEVYTMPRSDVFFYLQKEIYQNFDFTNSSIILVSVLGEIGGPAPHCQVSYSYNNDKSTNLVTVKWKEGIEPIKNLENLDKEKAAIIQFAIGVGKISSDTPIEIKQEFFE